MGNTALVVMVDGRRAGGMLSAARAVCDEVDALAVGPQGLVDEAKALGFDKVSWMPAEEDVPVEAFAPAVGRFAAESHAKILVSNDDPRARVLLGFAAGAVNASVVGSAIGFAEEAGGVAVDVQLANGEAIGRIASRNPIAAVFIGPDEDMSCSETADIQRVDAAPGAARIVGATKAAGTGLAAATRIVGVGAGLSSKENLSKTDELAQTLGAEIACTLPACNDMHWYGPERVLGSSHNQAAPDLYIAVGISGSPNHTSGVRDAKTIVAINSDEGAPIFKVAKYGIVGDLNKIVPALTEALAR